MLNMLQIVLGRLQDLGCKTDDDTIEDWSEVFDTTGNQPGSHWGGRRSGVFLRDV